MFKMRKVKSFDRLKDVFKSKRKARVSDDKGTQREDGGQPAIDGRDNHLVDIDDEQSSPSSTLSAATASQSPSPSQSQSQPQYHQEHQPNQEQPSSLTKPIHNLLRSFRKKVTGKKKGRNKVASLPEPHEGDYSPTSPPPPPPVLKGSPATGDTPSSCGDPHSFLVLDPRLDLTQRSSAQREESDRKLPPNEPLSPEEEIDSPSKGNASISLCLNLDPSPGDVCWGEDEEETESDSAPTRRGRRASAVSPCLSPVSNGSTPTGVSLTQELGKLSRCGWYWGPISRSEAEDKLNLYSDGAFLVRDSSDDHYLLSLSFRSYGRTFHTRIEHTNGLFSFYAQPEPEGNYSVISLIEMSVERSKDGVFCYSRGRSPGSPSFPVRLTRPVSRFTQNTCHFPKQSKVTFKKPIIKASRLQSNQV